MRIGICLDNVEQPAEQSCDKITVLRPHLVETLWTRADREGEGGTQHRRAAYDRLEALLDRPTYHVRVGPSRALTPDAWCAMAADALAELPSAALAERRVRLRALNEVNLPADGAWHATEQAAAALVEAQRQMARIKEEIGV
jgi:hypothetical protein